MKQTNFNSIVTKGEIAHDDRFLHLPKLFQLIQKWSLMLFRFSQNTCIITSNFNRLSTLKHVIRMVQYAYLKNVLSKGSRSCHVRLSYLEVNPCFNSVCFENIKENEWRLKKYMYERKKIESLLHWGKRRSCYISFTNFYFFYNLFQIYICLQRHQITSA